MQRVQSASLTRVDRLLRADEAMLCWMRRLQTPWMTGLMRSWTRAGDGATWVLLSLLLFASGGVASTHARLLSLAALIALGLSQGLKRLCRRVRPSCGIVGFTALTENPDVFSFPSGHTCVASAVALALAGQGVFLGALMGTIALGVGISRVYLGAHYPLDVAFGACLGALTGLLTRLLIL